ncbi:hypothetical protein PF008_g10699 [Phytophthora fragariae]|uniref:Uncharacterized protein n=1 Tax=Phytophthora fragariae TaxID=53985 RepID=A0A6G0RUG2_9STRA|nr:hypothetical protein PF003_g40704 [Phytophthora fragariae]KAE9341290.1 hypothetical protein PF008_g10699 [Phytophthora fragariae]
MARSRKTAIILKQMKEKEGLNYSYRRTLQAQKKRKLRKMLKTKMRMSPKMLLRAKMMLKKTMLKKKKRMLEMWRRVVRIVDPGARSGNGYTLMKTSICITCPRSRSTTGRGKHSMRT